MTNQNTDSQVGRRRRYTVSRLLELAPHTRGKPFDLSKFTYDAARAGVVPPLGACVMSTRRTLSDQPRNWSQESSSSQEDLIIYRGNRIVKEPVRQPKGPPIEVCVPQDEGFARFLKKHSSPTHQRVTAGGRIVPMEHRPRPPACQLVSCKSTPEPDRKNNAREGGAMHVEGPKLDTGGHVKPNEDTDDVLQVQPQPQVQVPGVNGLMDHNALTAGINVNLVTNGDALPVDTTAAQSHWLAPMLASPVSPNMYPDPYYLQSPQVFPSCAMPLTPPVSGYNGTLDGQLFMPMAPFPDIMGLHAPTEMPVLTAELAPTDAGYLDQMVASATARFQELDRQLKMIDRHRAMRNRDPYLSEHRMAVVQMRANAKADISYWSNMAAEAKGAPKPSIGAPGSTLNVEAAAYVPLQSNSLVATSSSKPSRLVEGSDSPVQPSQPKRSPKAGRRGIPIVPPPETSDLIVKKPEDAAPTQFTAVQDGKWGVRVGHAPPGLLRRQEELAKAMIREDRVTPHKSARASSVESPVAGHPTSSVHDQAVESSPGENEENKLEREEWLPTNPGRAPASIEACYELQLDAMRLPKGVVSKIKLPDGTITQVRGRGLQRPPSLGMDDFERRYWKSKPVLTKEMTSQFVEVRACDEGPVAEMVLDYVDSNRPNNESMRTASVRENTNKVLSSSSSGSSNGFRDRSMGGRNDVVMVPGRTREHGHKEHHSATFGSNGSEPSSLTFKQSSASSTPLWLRGDDKSGWFAGEVTLDAAINKGFSCVSVQNVHAIGRLPHMLDGATDSQRRSARLMLSAAGKGRSPQRGHSATTASDAFSGPSHRAEQGFTAKSDDEIQSRVVKQGEM